METRTLEWTIADRLWKAREYAGLDQRQLAEQMGVSRQTVSNYENANTRPRRIVLNAWAAITGVEVAWLETGRVELPRLDLNQRTSDYTSAPWTLPPTMVIRRDATIRARSRRNDRRLGDRRSRMQPRVLAFLHAAA